MERFRFITEKNYDELPKTSGVYVFYSQNELVYIGKAINIKNRVKSHFFQPSYRDNLFINKVDKIGFFETNSEIEALVLEANLIKKHQPKYNVIWKDDKNYFYVAIAQNSQKIPYVFITHQKDRGPSSIQFVGPFVEGTPLKKTLKFLRKVFPYYTSAKHPKVKCTWCHLDLCPGPKLFENPPSPEASEGLREYRRNLKKLVLILEGKRFSVLKSLKQEMRELSAKNKFEEAGKIRDRMQALQNIMLHTRVISEEKEIVSFLPRGKNPTTKLFAKILGLEEINRIECYDVSNIQGKNATASMVVATDGKIDKKEYKKFKIKGLNTPNDIAMLKETLQRRFNHSEWTYPEVILIDGGIAQLNVAINTKLEARNPKQVQNIKIISIAKKFKELFIEGRERPVLLKTLPREIYNLVLQLDDEAHRFSIAYHKKLRKKSLLQ